MSEACFSADYQEARAKFLETSRAAGVALESHACPGQGPDGGALFTDVARHGPEQAEKILLTISATHGVEGFCGSGAQVATLRDLPALPEGTAMVQIHAINPHGFAWQRRVTEENVDLNRNFIDFAKPPANPGYDRLHSVLLPERWDDAAIAAMDEAYDRFAAEEGDEALRVAVAQGQYNHDDGIFYGGAAPTWPHRTLKDVVKRHTAGARLVGVIDYHTGLGPRGFGERISDHMPGTAAHQRMHDWYGGDLTSILDGSAVSPALLGLNLIGIEEAAAPAEVAFVALEFGTVPYEDVRLALLADNWLHQKGEVNSEQGRAIKAQIRAAFYGEDAAWKNDIVARSLETQRLALRGLATS